MKDIQKFIRSGAAIVTISVKKATLLWHNFNKKMFIPIKILVTLQTEFCYVSRNR
jgi:hypothetical protein